MSVIEVPRARWKQFCADLTHSHRGWRGSIDVVREDAPPRTIFRNAVFLGMSAELDGKEEDAFLITTRQRSEEVLTHIIRRPHRLQARFDGHGVPEVVRVDAAAGATVMTFPEVPSAATAEGSVWRRALSLGR